MDADCWTRTEGGCSRAKDGEGRDGDTGVTIPVEASMIDSLDEQWAMGI